MLNLSACQRFFSSANYFTLLSTDFLCTLFLFLLFSEFVNIIAVFIILWFKVLDFSLALSQLEKATLSTIEGGQMTKDLALITSLKDVKVLNSREFILAIREKLETM